MPLPHLRLLVLDTETTGFVPKVHRVIEYACALIEDGKVVQEYEQLLELPEGDEVPAPVQVLTRIYPEDLIDKPIFETILPEIAAMVTPETVIVGQNIPYDIGMLRGEGWDLTEQPWIDTAMLASVVFPDLSSYSLGYVSKALTLNHSPHHRALGDVRATVEFLAKCCDRLQELPSADLAHLQEIAKKGPVGYQRLFAALSSTKKTAPAWLDKTATTGKTVQPVAVPVPGKGTVALMEEPIDRTFLSSVFAGLSGTTWCAVKNIEAAVDRHMELGEVTVLYPPEFVVSQESVDGFLAQPVFTADEMTLAMKLHLYQPSVRSDIPIHGNEYAVFSGKLASAEDGAEYQALLKKAASGPAVLSHQHLLEMCDDAAHGLPEGIHVIIDDASMLEDTATNAYAWTCHIPSLRASSEGNDLLTKCVDLIELYAERLRNDMNLRYIAPSDLASQDVLELRRVVEHVVTQAIPPQAAQTLQQLLKIFDPENLDGRFAWVESMQDGSKTIKSVPEDIGELLADRLYDFVSTTLLIPIAGAGFLSTILPPRITRTAVQAPLPTPVFSLSLSAGQTMEELFRKPVGKTIILVPSKRVIEDIFVRHTESLEDDGVTLLCQGFSGGSGRMQAEFLVASEPTVMVLTPWMYEGMDLAPETVDTIILQTMPFDHPAHAVVSRRAERFGSPFMEYSLPRLMSRLFRLLRTFSRHAKTGAVFQITDDRLRTKPYGKHVSMYLEDLFRVPSQGSTTAKKSAKSEGQMSLL